MTFQLFENLQQLKYKYNIPQELINWADGISQKFSTWIVFAVLKDYYNTNDLNKIKNTLSVEDKRILMDYVIEMKHMFELIINDLFLVTPKPVLDLKTLSLAQAVRRTRYMPVITEWANDNNIKDLETRDWEDTISDAVEWHSDIFGDTSKTESGDVFLKFDDGYYWTNLQKRECDDEAVLMGHCGRTAGDVLFSLKDKKKKSHLSAGYRYRDQMLTGLKGKANTKPKRKYHKYIIALLRNSKYPIKGFDLEYNTGTDFKMSDLEDESIR